MWCATASVNVSGRWSGFIDASSWSLASPDRRLSYNRRHPAHDPIARSDRTGDCEESMADPTTAPPSEARTPRMMPDDGLATLRESDAIFLGAVGGPARVPDDVPQPGPLLGTRRCLTLATIGIGDAVASRLDAAGSR
jgi:hypothetical protein